VRETCPRYPDPDLPELLVAVDVLLRHDADEEEEEEEEEDEEDKDDDGDDEGDDGYSERAQQADHYIF
jgi:hypothetical protein